MATDGIANYGAKSPDTHQNIKQFLPGSPSQATWVYKKLISDTQTLSSGTQVQTPANSNVPVYINNNLYVNGNVYANAFIVPSDKKIKDNIVAMSETDIANFENLEPKTFNYKTQDASEKHYGFIAQEVEQIYPQLVKENPSGIKTLNYMEMVPLLVLKINKMQQEIDELKKSANR